MAETRHTEGPVSITYDIQGEGPLVTFLHGIGGNRRNWTGQLAHFGSRFCAVAWDARGYLGSDDSPQTLQFSDFADDLLRLLDQLKVEQAHLVGLSMGGMIIQDFYGRHADRVATLALVDTSSGFGTASEEIKQDFLARRLEPLEKGLTPADIAPEVVKVLVAPSAAQPIRDKLIASMSALRVDSYKQALHAIVSTDFRTILPHISVPTLVIVGEEDQVTPPAASEFLVKNIPGASLATIPGSGHLTNIEQPKAFNATLGAFLDKHARQASQVSS
jgi:pimeloyl-ACP methyl ester carboxylesterase